MPCRSMPSLLLLLVIFPLNSFRNREMAVIVHAVHVNVNVLVDTHMNIEIDSHVLRQFQSTHWESAMQKSDLRIIWQIFAMCSP